MAAMGETILRVSLGELSTVRVRCKCGTVAEIGLPKLSVLDGATCPGCGNKYCPGGALADAKGPFSAFQNVVELLADKSARFTIEFPVNLDRHGG
jgi:hypothetical protein